MRVLRALFGRDGAITRRGCFLLLFGTLYTVIGYSYLAPPDAPSTAAVKHALRIILTLAPLHFYGWAWVAVGLVMIAGGVTRRLEWIAYGVAMLMPCAWAIISLDAFFAGDQPRGWVSAVLFGLIAAAVGVVSGMPEPRDLRRSMP